MTITAGEYETRKGKPHFVQQIGGKEYEYFIRFDNGSTLGHCRPENLQNSIEGSIITFNELQT